MTPHLNTRIKPTSYALSNNRTSEVRFTTYNYREQWDNRVRQNKLITLRRRVANSNREQCDS